MKDFYTTGYDFFTNMHLFCPRFINLILLEVGFIADPVPEEDNKASRAVR